MGPCLLDQLHCIHSVRIVYDDMMMNCPFGSNLRHTDIFQIRSGSPVSSLEFFEKSSSLLICLGYSLRSEIFFICQDQMEISFPKICKYESLNSSNFVIVIIFFDLLRSSFSFFLPRTSGSSIISRNVFLDLFNLSKFVCYFRVQKQSSQFP